jgi:hypothetical protein
MPRKFSEDQTRKEMIDLPLEKADWNLHGNCTNFSKIGATKANRWFIERDAKEVVEFENQTAV